MTENNDSTNSENEKRFVNIAKEPIFIVVNDTFENEVLADDDVVDCLNALHKEKNYWKKRALLLENKYNEGDSIEWLRNNTVWEQMPTNKRTYTTTSSDGKND